MSWLLGQLWPLLVLAGLLGAVGTTALMTTRVTVERWVQDEEVPAERPFPVLGEVSAAAAPAPFPGPAVARSSRSSSPFPPLPGHDPGYRPWEAEELWSRPARSAGTGAAGTDG